MIRKGRTTRQQRWKAGTVWARSNIDFIGDGVYGFRKRVKWRLIYPTVEYRLGWFAKYVPQGDSVWALINIGSSEEESDMDRLQNKLYE